MRITLLSLFILSSLLNFGQTTVFNLGGGGTFPSGWTETNGVASEPIDKTSYWMIQTSGGNRDTITSTLYDLSSYGSAEFDIDIRSFGSGGHNSIKVDVSLDGGASYVQSFTGVTTTTTYQNSGTLTITTVSANVVLRITNSGASGRGVRMQNLELRGIGTTCSTPVDVSAAGASSANQSLDLSWTNSSCYDEVVVFIDQTNGINTTPSGGAGSYTGNSVYSSNGQCVYKGTASSFTTSNLTNGSLYYFEIFTRRGTTWSSGIETSGTPTYNGFEITSVNSVTTIDFDNTVSGINSGTYTGTGFSSTPSSGQINSNSWEIIGFSGGTINYGASANNVEVARGISTGATTAGGLHAFEVSSGDYAFGVQPSGSEFTPGSFTLRVLNSTGSTMSSVLLEYDFYTRADQGRGNSLNFSHSDDGSSFTNVSSLDFTSDQTSISGASWRLSKRFVLISGLSIANGSFYYLRWSGADVNGTGSRDEFALDNINLSLRVTTPSAISINAAAPLESIGSDGADLTLTSVTRTDDINLSNSILTMGNNDLQIVETAFTGSNSEYIYTSGTGEVVKTYNANGSFLFPIGNSGYTPVTLDFTSGTYSSAYAAARVLNLAHSNISGVSDYIDRYWDLSASGISSYSVNVSAVYLDTDTNGVESNMYSQAWNGSAFQYDAAVNGSTNTLSFTGIPSLSDFTGAAVAALPIKLSYFKGSNINNINLIEWESFSEKNCSYYTIFKSIDAQNFFPLGNVIAAGNSNTTKQYSKIDPVLSDENYYRLQQTDYNGISEFIGKTLVLKSKPSKVVISYTPSHVNILSDRDLKYYSIISIDGKKVQSGQFTTELHFNKSNFNLGLYIIEISTEVGLPFHVDKMTIN